MTQHSPPSRSTTNHHRDLLFHTASLFQFLEFTLKSYLEESYDLIRYKVRPELKYDFSRKDVKKASFGELADKFSKICPNDKLTKRLNKLPKKRNEVMHQEFLHHAAIDAQIIYEEKTEAVLKAKIKTLDSLQKEVTYCLKELTEEFKNLKNTLESKTQESDSQRSRSKE